MNVLPVLLKDFYKADHKPQYPNGTQLVYSNLTPRISRMEGVNYIIPFGIQFFAKKYLIKAFNEDFFKQPKAEVVAKYKRRMDNALGPNAINTGHIEALHDLGYLPIHLKALPEGMKCPLRVPVLTIRNTKPEFFWLTNFLETLLSNCLWHPMTSATIANAYRELLDKYAARTSDIPEFVQWQGHDFSMRGQTSLESAMVNGGAHMLSFTGSDTVPSIDWLEEYYKADCEKELIGGSVPATEHSVMCFGGQGTEKDTYKRLLTEVYPKGIVSIVSDTWDYWHVLTVTLPELKTEIMAREGKFVIRPDSGDPVKIVCGDADEPVGTPAYRGTIEILWDTFGGTTNSKGYKQLDAHVGCIYGDSITIERCAEICKQLEQKGFASTNMVFGIGSYTYQYVTRDTFGFAMKATYGIINGNPIEVFKDPLTDKGVKKSAKGLLRVNKDMSLSECVTEAEEQTGMLETVFKDGVLVREQSLADIRGILTAQRQNL